MVRAQTLNLHSLQELPRKRFIVDTERGFLFDELMTAGGGFNNWGKTFIKGTDGQTLDMWSKTSTPIVNPSLNNFRGQIRRIPTFVLLEALDRAATLRWVGEDEIAGKKQRVISVIRPDNQQLALFFDALTNLLTRYDYLYADPMAGDAVIAQVYPAYRNAGRLKLPTGRVLINSGGIVQETEYTDVQINTRPAESVFEAPQGFEKLAAPPATPPPPAVSKVADDVYFLQGLQGAHITFYSWLSTTMYWFWRLPNRLSMAVIPYKRWRRSRKQCLVSRSNTWS